MGFTRDEQELAKNYSPAPKINPGGRFIFHYAEPVSPHGSAQFIVRLCSYCLH
jgi:hypothetical protein